MIIKINLKEKFQKTGTRYFIFIVKHAEMFKFLVQKI